eukprot:scaffold8569_cov177-Ochromonas_danica.AAC.6
MQGKDREDIIPGNLSQTHLVVDGLEGLLLAEDDLVLSSNREQPNNDKQSVLRHRRFRDSTFEKQATNKAIQTHLQWVQDEAIQGIILNELNKTQQASTKLYDIIKIWSGGEDTLRQLIDPLDKIATDLHQYHSSNDVNKLNNTNLICQATRRINDLSKRLRPGRRWLMALIVASFITCWGAYSFLLMPNLVTALFAFFSSLSFPLSANLIHLCRPRIPPAAYKQPIPTN